MTLEKHIVDTIKEWQMKIGVSKEVLRLYYPKESICLYLQLPENTENALLQQKTESYIREHASYLEGTRVSYQKDRFCVAVSEAGSRYVAEHVELPSFLVLFLAAIKKQDMEAVRSVFRDYAREHHGTYIEDREEDGLGTVFYFEQEELDAYAYCVEQDVFGVTYHRFAREDYERLLEK